MSDRPDFDSGRQVHVIYMVPAGATDNKLDTDGTLECSVVAQNQWMAQQTGGLEWRLDTFLLQRTVGGVTRTVAVPDITFIQSTRTPDQLDSAGEVSAELGLRRINDSAKRYLTYVESGSNNGGACGDAYWPLPMIGERWGGQYAQVYLRSNPGCGANRFGVPGAPSFSETIAQQELMHNDGMTPAGAPHSCPYTFPFVAAHVCTAGLASTEGTLNLDPERFDVMFPYAGVSLHQKVLDRGHDDYFRHDFPFEDLENSPFLRPVTSRPPVPQNGGQPEPQPSSSPTSGPQPSPQPSSSPSDEPQPAERSVSLAADRTSVRAGRTVTLTGTLTSDDDSCTQNGTIELHARGPRSTTYSTRATTTTDDDGRFEFTIRLRRTRVLRVVAPATVDCTAAISPDVKVRVRR